MCHWLKQVIWLSLKSVEGESVFTLENLGRDEEVKMNWDQIIPLIILWIMHVVWLNRHLAREPGS